MRFSCIWLQESILQMSVCLCAQQYSANCIKTWSMSILRHFNTVIAKKIVWSFLFWHLPQFAALGLRLLSYCVQQVSCLYLPFFHILILHCRAFEGEQVFISNCDAEEPKKQCKTTQKWKKSVHFFRWEPKQCISPPTSWHFHRWWYASLAYSQYAH